MENKLKIEQLAREFDLRLRLARAAELATVESQADALRKAKDLLYVAKKFPETAEELDLLARICVKMGNYTGAHACWRNAMSISKEKIRYEEAVMVLRSYLDNFQKDRTREELYYLIGGVVFILLLILFLISI